MRWLLYFVFFAACICRLCSGELNLGDVLDAVMLIVIMIEVFVDGKREKRRRTG